MWNDRWYMKVIIMYTVCCNNLWKSIIMLWKSLEYSGNFFSYFVATLFGAFWVRKCAPRGLQKWRWQNQHYESQGSTETSTPSDGVSWIILDIRDIGLTSSASKVVGSVNPSAYPSLTQPVILWVHVENDERRCLITLLGLFSAGP